MVRRRSSPALPAALGLGRASALCRSASVADAIRLLLPFASLPQVKKGEPTTLYSKGRILGYKRCVCLPPLLAEPAGSRAAATRRLRGDV